MNWTHVDTVIVIVVIASLISAYDLGYISGDKNLAFVSTMRGIPEVNLSSNPGAYGHIMEVYDAALLYHLNHKYMNRTFDCKFMAMDLWNMIETRGINAKIMAGSVDNDITLYSESDHVWVIAEVAPGSWIAVEATGGYLVCDGNVTIQNMKTNESQPLCISNPRYYHGWVFDTPMDYMEHVRWENT